MTERQRLEAEFKAWEKEHGLYANNARAAYEAGWLAAKEDTLRTVRELGSALFQPKH